VEIPLDMEDPLERLHYVSQETAALKGGRIAEGVNVLFSLLGMLPAPVQALLDPLLDTSLPLFNMVITNVPGPKFPLYSMGRRMTAHIPYVPIGYAMGCGGAILSYDQKLFCGLTSDAQAMPDGEVLRDLLEQSYAELREATGVKTPRRRTTKAVKKRRAAKLAHTR
jgi:diacylglycerol O-acyltransferase